MSEQAPAPGFKPISIPPNAECTPQATDSLVKLEDLYLTALVDQATRNKQHPKVPVVYKNQVTVTMTKVGGQWLVDDLSTNLQS